MDKEQIDELKVRCKKMLENSGLTIKSKQGKQAVCAFWIGVLQVEDLTMGKTNAGIGLMLMAGRVEELVA